MSIAWIYLDKKSAAVSALKDYAEMDFIIKNTPEDISDVRGKMTATQLPTVSDMPKGTPDPHAGEARLVSQIDEIDVLKERYRLALEYMEWFCPAWDTLTDNERFILLEFYREDGEGREDAIGNIRDRFHIERSSAYNKKNRALSKLTLLLYGK